MGSLDISRKKNLFLLFLFSYIIVLYLTKLVWSYFLVLADILQSSPPPGASLYVAGKLPTHPFPKPTFCLK